MKQRIIYFTLPVLALISCKENNKDSENKKNSNTTMNDSISFKSGYSDVNGIKMYYEIYGEGKPLVLIPGG
ncbi:MAG TPA: alpha/beta hydrolase, partial [Chitinophagaceae bacterium]|nr:alpha/beta hydrolase [Chitinophagaceae bacterium]